MTIYICAWCQSNLRRQVEPPKKLWYALYDDGVWTNENPPDKVLIAYAGRGVEPVSYGICPDHEYLLDMGITERG